MAKKWPKEQDGKSRKKSRWLKWQGRAIKAGIRKVTDRILGLSIKL
jgi:hypothetical protein